jgi:decaprenylphospho-beta-D-erythro-pentofuranosid-2-ulose 2-reductase
VRDALGDVQSVLVLGGRSELAVATVRALVTRRTRRVVLAVRDVDAVKEELEELRRLGAEAEAVAFDALDTRRHAALVKRLWAEHGDFDLVLVAFGVLGDQERAEREATYAVEVVRANFTGAVSLLVPIAQRMREQGHGTIAVLSSLAGMRPRRANFVYGASKAGLDAFSNGLGDALDGSGVQMLVVRPGFVFTRMTEGMTAAPFSTTPEVVAQQILRGIAQDRTVVYAPPVLRYVAPLLLVLPRFVWRRMPR